MVSDNPCPVFAHKGESLLPQTGEERWCRSIPWAAAFLSAPGGMHIGMLIDMPSEQIAVRLDSDLLAALDSLVEQGDFDSRAAAVRRGLEIVVRLARERGIDEKVVAGYTRVPPTEWEDTHALLSMVESIDEEPW
jgi:Arc/MetJ-type ribon-helix-helix transcriptional regulator